MINSDRPRRSLLISTSRPAATTAHHHCTGSGGRIWTENHLTSPRNRNIFGQRNSAVRSESISSLQVPTNSDTVYTRPSSRSGSRPNTALRQRRQKRPLLPFLQNALSARPPSSRRHPRRYHKLNTETASQQFLLLSAAALSNPLQHASRSDGSSLYTNLAPVTTTPCDGPPIISTAISGPSPSFEEGFQRATHESSQIPSSKLSAGGWSNLNWPISKPSPRPEQSASSYSSRDAQDDA